jgi:L-lactate dehydrogenase complex protein LldF
MSGIPEQKIRETLANDTLQAAIYSGTGRLAEKRAVAVGPESLPDFQELRTQANLLKRHTIENLDRYLEQFEAAVEANGGKVIYAHDGAEVVAFLLELARKKSAHLIVKSKSMTSEEIDLDEHLEQAGIEAVETDLGEYIIQLAGERPYHIVAPALHKTRYEVADLFTAKLGIPREIEIEKQTRIARSVLRQKFLAADIGVSGANFLVADSGAVVLIENEGNIRLTTSAPKVHVAIAGIEKLIPRAQDLAVFLKLLGRSATGQPLSVYTSFLSGPRRESEPDGPDEFYVVLLDNGRTRLLADEKKRESLYCIRCGACLNHCPVFRKIGGHAYPWVYSGPIGAVLTPQYRGLHQEPWLPFASSLCGACGEVCPVKIDLPGMLLALRSDTVQARASQGQGRLERLAWRAWAWVMRHPAIYEMLGMMGAEALDGGVPPLLKVGPLRAWLSQRDLAPPPAASFRQLWRERARTARK